MPDKEGGAPHSNEKRKRRALPHIKWQSYAVLSSTTRDESAKLQLLTSHNNSAPARRHAISVRALQSSLSRTNSSPLSVVAMADERSWHDKARHYSPHTSSNALSERTRANPDARMESSRRCSMSR